VEPFVTQQLLARLLHVPVGASFANRWHQAVVLLTWRSHLKLFSEAEERPAMIVVRAGTLDDADQVEVEGIIWTSEAPSWAYLNPDVPHFERQPPAPQVKNSQ